ncbi:protein containing RecF/RecN/SMC protein [Candidatus Magnetomorum sp. HK-1]|nr:protein containing RecF/RecN/SMC protein [Candidatus Magnetomorum sp. HK-1]
MGSPRRQLSETNYHSKKQSTHKGKYMHTFKNFKNFKQIDIDLSNPMTLLIGRNGSGKSNIIEGVILLAELIKGKELNDFSDIGRGGQCEIRGGVDGCFRHGCDSFELGFKDTIVFKKKEQKISFQISASNKLNIKVKKKALLGDKDLLDLLPTINKDLKTFSEKDILLLAGLFGGLGLISAEDKGLKAIGSFIAGLSIIEAINQNNKQKELPGQNKSDYSRLLKKYNKICIFDILPRKLRYYNPKGEKVLNPNGSNLSSVIYDLDQNQPEILNNILKLIRQLPEEPFEQFEFIETSDDKEVLFALKNQNGETIKANLLSDGTLRAIAILTALETIPEGSRTIIEEIDNGIHSSRVNLLIDEIWKICNRRHLNTLITTHNPSTLDSLTIDQLKCVLLTHYDKKSNSARLTPFFELPDVDILLQKDKLGGLVTRNVIERYLDPDFHREQKSIALQSLKRLESIK